MDRTRATPYVRDARTLPATLGSILMVFLRRQRRACSQVAGEQRVPACITRKCFKAHNRARNRLPDGDVFYRKRSTIFHCFKKIKIRKKSGEFWRKYETLKNGNFQEKIIKFWQPPESIPPTQFNSGPGQHQNGAYFMAPMRDRSVLRYRAILPKSLNFPRIFGGKKPQPLLVWRWLVIVL